MKLADNAKVLLLSLPSDENIVSKNSICAFVDLMPSGRLSGAGMSTIGSDSSMLSDLDSGKSRKAPVENGAKWNDGGVGGG